VDDTYPSHRQIWREEKEVMYSILETLISSVDSHIGDVIGHLAVGTPGEEDVEDEEGTPAEHEREKHQSQNLRIERR
jgi:hypothetical protein